MVYKVRVGFAFRTAGGKLLRPGETVDDTKLVIKGQEYKLEAVKTKGDTDAQAGPVSTGKKPDVDSTRGMPQGNRPSATAGK